MNLDLVYLFLFSVNLKKGKYKEFVYQRLSNILTKQNIYNEQNVYVHYCMYKLRCAQDGSINRIEASGWMREIVKLGNLWIKCRRRRKYKAGLSDKTSGR